MRQDNQLRTRLSACTGEGVLVQNHALRVRRHGDRKSRPGRPARPKPPDTPHGASAVGCGSRAPRSAARGQMPLPAALAANKRGSGTDSEHVTEQSGMPTLLALPLLHDFPEPGRSHRFPCSSAPSDTKVRSKIQFPDRMTKRLLLASTAHRLHTSLLAGFPRTLGWSSGRLSAAGNGVAGTSTTQMPGIMCVTGRGRRRRKRPSSDATSALASWPRGAPAFFDYRRGGNRPEAPAGTQKPPSVRDKKTFARTDGGTT
jgi:hypothetical protein